MRLLAHFYGLGVLGLLLSSETGISMARGAVYELVDESALLQAARAARPGDSLLLAPGDWKGGLTIRDLQGEPGRPILLGAMDSAKPPRFVGGGSGVHLVASSHVEIQDWVIERASGNGLNLDDGGGSDAASGVTLRRISIRDIGPRGNHDGFKLSGVNDFRIEECLVERWGDAGSAIDLVGCHDGLILNCRFRYRGDLAANGVQAKGGSSKVVVRGCWFDHAGSRGVNLGGSTGADYFRPRGATYEARDLTVMDCVFLGSQAPIAFVGVDGALVQNNTFFHPGKWVLRILQESRAASYVPCQRGVFRDNLVVFRSSEVRSPVNVGPGTRADTFSLEGNHWYCEDLPERSRPRNLPVPETRGTHGIDPGFMNPAQLDFRVAKDRLGREVGARLERMN